MEAEIEGPLGAASMTWPAWPWPPPLGSLPDALRVPPGPAAGVIGPFPNHDCAGLSSPVMDWDGLRSKLATTECPRSKHTRVLRCAARILDWEASVLPYLEMRQPRSQAEFAYTGGKSINTAIAGSSSFRSSIVPDVGFSDEFPAFERVEAAAAAECPLGVLILNIARTLRCAKARHSDCYLKHTQRISKSLFETPLSVIMGTEWPLFALLSSYDWSWPGIPRGQDYDCRFGNHSIGDWQSFRSCFIPDALRSDASWYTDSLRYVFSDRLAKSLYTASTECLYGVYTMNLIKAIWAADTESSSYNTYAPYAQWILFESVHLLGATSWPLLPLFHYSTSVRRHGFQIDFSARELAGLPLRPHAAWLQAQPLSLHVATLDMFGTWRPDFAQAVMAFQVALGRSAASSGGGGPDAERLVYVTMVYGRFNRFIPGWAARSRLLGLGNLVIAVLDLEASAICRAHHDPRLCVKLRIDVLNKYTLLLVALQLGIDVMWLDFDIFLVRNPGPAIAAAARRKDGRPNHVVVGYDYESDCLCNGFFYLRARPAVHRWLFELVRWLFDHPYEHDQRAIAGFLNYTERIAANSQELPPVPRWDVFDVNNIFVNFGSWEGRTYEDLVLVHFVDGSAFSLYGRSASDPSVPQAKLEQIFFEQSGAPAEDLAGPMEAFYKESAVAAAPEEIWDKVPALRRLMDSKRVPFPAKKQPCGILPGVHSAHEGYGWISGAVPEPAWPTDED
eukprot:TRINITY_DN18779_c0_g1_i2.p1 TRINITY_DN18779_c0_g1~~TRINITY_DN18779_c0_g1_i2.p1  ORF type:complete len:732 (+),score=68.42 TRINITY_DN18779_c0_g1_i2:284-2479(+)